jgi:hypothetical protein
MSRQCKSRTRRSTWRSCARRLPITSVGTATGSCRSRTPPPIASRMSGGWSRSSGGDGRTAGLATSPDDVIFAFHCHVGESDEAARAAAAEAFDLYVATRLYARRQTYDDILQSGLGLFGSVETVAAKLAQLQQWGIRHVALLMDFGLMPADRMHRSMDLVAREVAPRVQARLEDGTAKLDSGRWFDRS